MKFTGIICKGLEYGRGVCVSFSLENDQTVLSLSPLGTTAKLVVMGS